MTSSDHQDRDLYSGLIRLPILHHAAKQPIFGFGVIEELARHGYRISPGTLYPLLKGLEKKGLTPPTGHWYPIPSDCGTNHPIIPTRRPCATG